jgi:hypothetical protein
MHEVNSQPDGRKSSLVGARRVGDPGLADRTLAPMRMIGVAPTSNSLRRGQQRCGQNLGTLEGQPKSSCELQP